MDDARIQKQCSTKCYVLRDHRGPAVGGLLLTGITKCSSYSHGHYIIAVILESSMDFKLYSKKATEVVEEKKETMLQNMKAGITYLKQHRVLSVIVWVALVINFFFGAFTVGYSFILVEELKVQSAHFGITEGALSIGMLVTSIYLSARKDIKFPLVVSKRGILIMGLLMAAATLPLLVTLSYFGIVSFYFVLMFSFGVAMIFVNTPIGVMMQKQIAEEYRGRVFGLLETMAMSLMPLAMVLFGFLFDIVPQYVLCLLPLCWLLSIMLRPSVMSRHILTQNVSP
jgi:hypothetical protein